MSLILKQRFSCRWNQLDVGIVILSVVGIVLEEVESKIIPINPTIIRVMRVLRIARVLKLLKMAKGIRALLDTVMQALPQVGNLGLLFFLLFFIFAALGVELFGRLGNYAFLIKFNRPLDVITNNQLFDIHQNFIYYIYNFILATKQLRIFKRKLKTSFFFYEITIPIFINDLSDQ